MCARRIMKCWDRDVNGNYILVERELADWNSPDAPPERERAERKLAAARQKMN
jgi:hypothetical protein